MNVRFNTIPWDLIIILILWCILIIIVYCILQRHYRSPEPSEELTYFQPMTMHSAIPNIIYTYWHDTIIKSEMVNKCINSWKQLHPDWQIIILNNDNLMDYLTVDVRNYKHLEKIAHLSDYIRLQILEQTGGFWLDASIYLNKPLNWIHTVQQETNAELIGYYINASTTDMRYPILENWFLAAVPNSRFIQDWNNEFKRRNDFDTVKAYVEDLGKNTNFQKLGASEYLAMHCAAQKIMQHYGPYNLKLFKAENGPLAYLWAVHWNVEQTYWYKDKNELKTPIVKFPGKERDMWTRMGWSKYLS